MGKILVIKRPKEFHKIFSPEKPLDYYSEGWDLINEKRTERIIKNDGHESFKTVDMKGQERLYIFEGEKFQSYQKVNKK